MAMNVSLIGMYIQSDRGVPTIGDIVTVAFYLPFDGVLKLCHLDADVISTSLDGFAIAYRQFDASLFRYIHKMMHETEAMAAPENAYPLLHMSSGV